jgi:hypothetical protein
LTFFRCALAPRDTTGAETRPPLACAAIPHGALAAAGVAAAGVGWRKLFVCVFGVGCRGSALLPRLARSRAARWFGCPELNCCRPPVSDMDEVAGDGGALLPTRRTNEEFIRESERADMGGVGDGAGVERTDPDASLQPLLPCVAR